MIRVLTVIAVLAFLPAAAAQAPEELLERLARIEKEMAGLAVQRAEIEARLFAARQAELRRRWEAHAPDRLVQGLVPMLASPDRATRDSARAHLTGLRAFGLPELSRQRLLAPTLERRDDLDRLMAEIRSAAPESLLRPSRGGRLVAFTEEWGPGWSASMLTDGQITDTAWCNQGQPATKHEYLFEFAFALNGGEGAWIEGLGLSNFARGYEAGGIKDFELFVTRAREPGSWVSLGRFVARRAPDAERHVMQRFSFPATFATHLKIRTLSNHGDPVWMMLNEVEAYPSGPDVPADAALAAAKAWLDGRRAAPPSSR